MCKKMYMVSIIALILTVLIFDSSGWTISNNKFNSEYSDIMTDLTKTTLNMDIDPCDDFYEFVCSKFQNETIIPEDKSQVSKFSLVKDKIILQLKDLLEEKILDNEIEPFKLMKRIYRTCNDIDTLNEQGLKPLFNYSSDIKNWPILDGDLEEYDWKDDMIKYSPIAVDREWIIDLNFVQDLKNSTKQILQIDQPILALDRENLIEGRENKQVKAYYEFINNVSKVINNNEDREDAIGEIVDFEIELGKLKLPAEETWNLSKFYNIQTIGDIENKKYNMFEPIGFLNYANAFIYDKNDNDLNELPRFNNSEPINNVVPDFLNKVDDLLQKTPKRIIKNYITWKLISEKLELLTEEMRNIILQYEFYKNGQKKRKPRWNECTDVTKIIVKYAVESAYARKYFDEESKSKVGKIVENVKNEFKKIIENLDWMDMETKDVALKKLNKMKSIIGYPIELVNDSLIIEEYKDYHDKWIDDNLVRSLINLNRYIRNKWLKEIREPKDKDDWKSYSEVAVANGYYLDTFNIIIVPAGILQGVFFDKKQPPVMNYGGIGTIIGHELTHGFDDQGSQFDEKGNLRNWWTPHTEKRFKIKANKIVEQYFNYTEPITGLQVNGNHTLNENIADNGGDIEAYNAFRVQEKSFDPQGKQLFWISFARIWCSISDKNYLENSIKTGFHSPTKFRVNGPLENNKNFADDFKCKKGSPMNPEIKNIVWG